MDKSENSKRSRPIKVVRIKTDSSKYMDMLAQNCTNPDCPCKDVNLHFFEADDEHNAKHLFRITLNYETWQLVSTEIFSDDNDYPKIIHEFMTGLTDELKGYILKGIVKDLKDVQRTDFDLSNFKLKELVYYGEAYHSETYDQLVFEFESINYFVMDHYCPSPSCKCKEVLLAFCPIDKEGRAKRAILSLRMKFTSGRYEIEDKDSGITNQFISQIYKAFFEEYEDEGLKFFEERYYRIKKWGEEFLLPKLNKENNLPIALKPKVGRNMPCPCGSGKKYKNCCGSDVRIV